MNRIAIKSLSFGVATFAISAAGLSVAFAAPASDLKMTEAQCATLRTEALAGGTGDLSMDVANRYVSDFKKADKNGDKKLSQAEWSDACKQGWVHTSSSSGASEGGSGSSEKTSDRTPGDPSPSRTPGASGTGAAGTEAGQTPSGTSDRTPAQQ
jgi:hypothetical protein